MYIQYFANDESLLTESKLDRNIFRIWAKEELEDRFIAHKVAVLSEKSKKQVISDDVNGMADIVAFCSKLWSRWIDINN